MRAFAILLTPVLFLAACSSMGAKEVRNYGEFENAYQSLRVYTPGVEGAACHLSTVAMRYEIVAPNVVTVPRSPSPIEVICTKGQHFTGTARLEAKTVVLDETRMAYVYPAAVSVPMGINPLSFDRGLSLF